MMRLLDLMIFLGVRSPWARSRLAYRLLWSVVAAERALADEASGHDLVRHQDRVDELVVASVVPLAVALALEAERFVQP